jgi:hypothetical protein
MQGIDTVSIRRTVIILEQSRPPFRDDAYTSETAILGSSVSWLIFGLEWQG